MKKFQNVLPMIVFSIVLVFGLIGCDLEGTECDPEKGICRWVFVEPVIDYSLPQFYLEGLWAKDDSSEELSIITNAHSWAYFSGTCPTCRPEVDPPMPVVRFYPFGNSSTHIFEFSLNHSGENILTIIYHETQGDNTGVEVSFSAVVLNNKLTVDGLKGNIRNFWDDGYVELNNFNGTYTLVSRPR
ncbi:MAG: hypothetical protein FWC97_10325 [Treponema sp.]|nr:hypothetical protein [Treponema sp.]